MQDAYPKIWERWDHVGAMDDPGGYLFRTAMNEGFHSMDLSATPPPAPARLV